MSHSPIVPAVLAVLAVLTVLAVLAVLVASAAPAVAVAPGDAASMQTACGRTDVGPDGDAVPPGFVADLVPDIFSDLFDSLPVPNFVKSLFGAC